MSETTLTTVLMFGRFAIVLVVLIAALAWFLRKPKNRHPMAGKRERNIEEIRAEASTTQDQGPGLK